MTGQLAANSSRLPPRGHLKPLDGVRGLAVLMVVCSHAFESNYEAGGFWVRLVGRTFYFGFFGVDLFFVLSGFLITGILFDSLQDPGYFRKFYARRMLRIFPLYYGVLLVMFALTPALHLVWGRMGWLLIFYLQNLEPQRIMTFSPGAGVGLYHFWSLAIEEQFYLVWPAVVFLVRGKRRLLASTLAGSAAALILRVLLLASGVSGFLIHATTITRADSLLVGGALALLFRSRHWLKVQQFAPWALAAATATIILGVLKLEPWLKPHPMLYSFWTGGLRYSVLAFGFACLIAWSLRPHSACKWLFERQSLCFLGKYSYGIYVLHVLVLGVVLLPLRASLLHWTGSKMMAVMGSGILSLAAAVVAAYVSFHLFEKQFLRLKHRFDYTRRSLNHSSPADDVLDGSLAESL